MGGNWEAAVSLVFCAPQKQLLKCNCVNARPLSSLCRFNSRNCRTLKHFCVCPLQFVMDCQIETCLLLIMLLEQFVFYRLMDLKWASGGGFTCCVDTNTFVPPVLSTMKSFHLPLRICFYVLLSPPIHHLQSFPLSSLHQRSSGVMRIAWYWHWEELGCKLVR